MQQSLCANTLYMSVHHNVKHQSHTHKHTHTHAHTNAQNHTHTHTHTHMRTQMHKTPHTHTHTHNSIQHTCTTSSAFGRAAHSSCKQAARRDCRGGQAGMGGTVGASLSTNSCVVQSMMNCVCARARVCMSVCVCVCVTHIPQHSNDR